MRNPDAVFISRDPLGDDVHRYFSQVEVSTDPGRGGDFGLELDCLDDFLSEGVGGNMVLLQVVRDVHQDLIDRVGMNHLRRQVAQVNFVNLSALLQVEGHPGWNNLKADLQAGVAKQLGPVDRLKLGQTVVGRLLSPLPVQPFDDLLDLKKPGPAGDPEAFEGWGNGQADGFARAGFICYY